MTVYPAGPAQMPPLDFDILLNSPQEPVEEVATTDETPTSPIKFYTDAYLYPDYSSQADRAVATRRTGTTKTPQG
ncbi:unnamed protein product [Rhizoctonia solani]|uniref:Uncharacterized protein n=1 Tax=Rhizoctonia solani TaxID=456999 RepID=A0A8H3CHZ0_9AGAM|nr:unnamed protein product [Rhizoctonia solani]